MADNLLLAQFRIKVRRFVHLCPRRLKLAFGPLVGGVIGLMGGIPGLLIGLLLGYFVGELFAQFFNDRRIRDYFRNPGSQKFFETVPGLAAWCALSVLVVSKNKANSSEEKILRQVILETSYTFTGPLADPLLIEHFTRLAWSKKQNLNPDLLAESLAARRALWGDAGDLGRILYSLAEGEKAKSLAREIHQILEPGGKPGPGSDSETGNSMAGIQKDPWKILGLMPGTPLKELKAHYRRLAKQFHPDELVVLDENQREAAARAFMAIKEAYKQIAIDK